jgi:hypothetical protein
MDKRKLSLPSSSPPLISKNWWQHLVNSINLNSTDSSSKAISNKPVQKLQRNSFGSATVAVQKLRESKWFTVEEEKLFCAVIENGFIVEVKLDLDNEPWFGVVMCNNKKGGFDQRFVSYFITTTKKGLNFFPIQKALESFKSQSTSAYKLNQLIHQSKRRNLQVETIRRKDLFPGLELTINLSITKVDNPENLVSTTTRTRI